MTQHFTVPGRLPGMNEIIAAAKQRYKGRNIAYNEMKKTAEMQVLVGIRQAKLKPVEEPVFIRFVWWEPNRRRDPSNISAGGKKFILDALVKQGILKNDGWRHIAGWQDAFGVSSQDGVDVTLETQHEEVGHGLH